MASRTTRITELGTAVGLVHDHRLPWPMGLMSAQLPGIDDDHWLPLLAPIAEGRGPERDLLLRALDNGRAFRETVLDGRHPKRVEWSGGAQSPWTSDVPRDLTVDHVYFIQAKYDSTCVLNTSPAGLADELLAEDAPAGRPSWYEEVAMRELQAYYREVRIRMSGADLPTDVRRLDAEHRSALKTAMRSEPADGAGPEQEAYANLCHAVSAETAQRWRRRLARSSKADQTRMLFRLLRISGGPYWLLGTKGSSSVRLAVTDTRSWRERFELRRFVVTASQAGQPQVDWRAEVVDRTGTDEGSAVFVDGYCELRWSHGKLQGHPECKVQVRTPLADLPGYSPMR